MTAREFAGRLALGTAQFGLAYGLNNTHGQPPLATVAAVLREAAAAGINLLDTAAVYGDAEARLGELAALTADFEIITKVAGQPGVAVAVAESLTRLRREAVAGVLFHSALSFSSEAAGWPELRAVRATGQAARIGLSTYRPAHLLTGDFATAPPDQQPTLLQVPLNVLDQSWVASLPALAARGVEVHARSAFLQGLLLREPAALPPFFAPLAPKLTRLRALAAGAGVPLPALLLLFAVQTPGVARTVIGVDSVANLHENLRAAAHWDAALALRPELLALAEPTDTFTLPYTWPKTT